MARRWLKTAGKLATSMAVGALAVIGIGQLFAFTRSTCSTLCDPVNAGMYGALGGLVFAFLWKKEPAPDDRDTDGSDPLPGG